MSSKSERQAAREAVAEYQEARLGELVRRVGDAVDRFHAGELDAFEVDQVIFQYSRAAKELWKFCDLSDVEFTASLIGDRAPLDWWERGAPRRRKDRSAADPSAPAPRSNPPSGTSGASSDE